ncbi:MAG: hypothetical protein Q7R71_00010 [bacterium]|nr:hypothetical protein [bacterium]
MGRRTVLAGERLHNFDPKSVMSGEEFAGIEAGRKQAELEALKEERKRQRHARAVKTALVLMHKRRDKRRRLKRVSTKAVQTIRALKLK